MAKHIDDVTDGELAILRVLWDRGEATTREITELLYDEVNDPKMATVQKLVERLEGKGCVTRDRSQRAHRFAARVSQNEFLASRLQSLADSVCDGALVNLMTTLVRSKGISRADRQQLRKLIDDVWPAKPSKS